jgi:surfactin synthase thioesterase subunit
VSVGIEALFTSALGLVPPWEVAKVELDTAQRRIDFEVRCSARTLTCHSIGAILAFEFVSALADEIQ